MSFFTSRPASASAAASGGSKAPARATWNCRSGGAGLYFTQLQWSDRAELDELVRITDLRSETSGFDFGLHGGVSLDIGLSDRIGLVGGVQGVHANVRGLEGFREGTYTYRSGTRDDGTLKIVEFGRDPGFPVLVVGEGTRTMDRYGSFGAEKEASVGLSGMRYTAGCGSASDTTGSPERGALPASTPTIVGWHWGRMMRLRIEAASVRTRH